MPAQYYAPRRFAAVRAAATELAAQHNTKRRVSSRRRSNCRFRAHAAGYFFFVSRAQIRVPRVAAHRCYSHHRRTPPPSATRKLTHNPLAMCTLCWQTRDVLLVHRGLACFSARPFRRHLHLARRHRHKWYCRGTICHSARGAPAGDGGRNLPSLCPLRGVARCERNLHTNLTETVLIAFSARFVGNKFSWGRFSASHAQLRSVRSGSPFVGAL